jgi:hypothetical protein
LLFLEQIATNDNKSKNEKQSITTGILLLHPIIIKHDKSPFYDFGSEGWGFESLRMHQILLEFDACLHFAKLQSSIKSSNNDVLISA